MGGVEEVVYDLILVEFWVHLALSGCSNHLDQVHVSFVQWARDPDLSDNFVICPDFSKGKRLAS